MKRFALIAMILSLVALAGCAQIQAKIATDVQPVLTADLDQALAAASKRPDTEQLEIQCYSGLKTWTANLPTTAPPLLNPADTCKGVALICDAELARIGIMDASTPAPPVPPLDRPTYNACLAAFADTKLAAIKLGAVLAGLAKGAGIAKTAILAPKP